MLFCCCENLLRPYCFIILIITLIFHIFEIVYIGQDFHKNEWNIALLICHMAVACSTLASFKGVISKDGQPLLMYLIIAAFGFIPIIIDMILVISDKKKIFMFDTSIIESMYGPNDAKLIVGLILLIVFAVKIDMTVVVCQYYKILKTENSTSAESARL